jgi:hypothetical protein
LIQRVCSSNRWLIVSDSIYRRPRSTQPPRQLVGPGHFVAAPVPELERSAGWPPDDAIPTCRDPRCNGVFVIASAAFLVLDGSP